MILSIVTKPASVFVDHVGLVFDVTLRAGLLAKLKPAGGLPPYGWPSLLTLYELRT